MREYLALVATLCCLGLISPAHGGEARPVGDPAVETRVARITEELRCLTCMGQSIADSHSGFSEDMRREIRGMITAGKSDKEIMDFMVQRYGDFVLYRPPVKETTLLLWVGPFALLLIGGVVLFRRMRQQSAAGNGAALTPEQQAAAARLLSDSAKRPT